MFELIIVVFIIAKIIIIIIIIISSTINTVFELITVSITAHFSAAPV